MGTAFEIADQIFQNVSTFKIHRHIISDFAPIDELIKESGRWFSLLRDVEDESAKSIRFKVWHLCKTAVFTILSFNNPGLGLEEQLRSIIPESSYFPYLAERVDQLRKIIAFLVENPENPKRKKVLDLLNESDWRKRGVGFVIALSRGSTPGWTEEAVKEVQRILPLCEVITSKRLLRQSTFRQIIVPSSGNISPILYELLCACRASRLDFVMYRNEGYRQPELRVLPKGTAFIKSNVKLSDLLPKNESETDDLHMDEWITKRFWESVRGDVINKGVLGFLDRDRQFLVRARLLILADKTKVYLRDDMKVIEISDLVERGASIEEYGKKFPRRLVNELREDDLIVLRTSGSGDYLKDVAEALMREDRKEGLLSLAFGWKKVLRTALQEHGSEKIALLLNTRKHNLSSHQYVWMWTTELVIRPQSEVLFYDLMAILDELGYRLDNTKLIDIAGHTWRQMREINRYHIMAGQRIRQSLLKRLRGMIEEGIVIKDSYHLSLPDVSAGEMTVFRISGIDPETVEIPYNHIGVIARLEI